MDRIGTFGVLTDEEYEIAKMLDKTGKASGCMVVNLTRALKNQPKGYRISYNKRENNRVLFWMQVLDNALHVKANLFHIGNYADKMDECSEKVKKSITDTKECDDCGLCPPRAPYAIDGKNYKPCCFHGHYFTKMAQGDWEMLRDLIVLEHDNQFEPEGFVPVEPKERSDNDKKYHGFYRK